MYAKTRANSPTCCACWAGCAELDAAEASCAAAAATFAASTTTAVAAASTAAAVATADTRGASGESAGPAAGSGRSAPAQGSRLRSMAGFGAAGVPGRVVAGEGGAELAHKAPGRSALGATTAGDGGSRSWKPGRSSSACWRRGEDCGAAATAAA